MKGSLSLERSGELFRPSPIPLDVCLDFSLGVRYESEIRGPGSELDAVRPGASHACFFFEPSVSDDETPPRSFFLSSLTVSLCSVSSYSQTGLLELPRRADSFFQKRGSPTPLGSPF